MKTQTSALLTTELVERAVTWLTPMIENLIDTSMQRTGTQRMVAYIVVLDPVPQPVDDRPHILWEGAVGENDPEYWPAGKDYAQFAFHKARLSHRMILPGHIIQRQAPFLFSKGDFKYGGSEYREGIIVATSGLEWYEDYAVSAALAGILHALSLGAFEEEYKKKAFFIGE